MGEKKLLIKFQADWADEFDVYGFCIRTEKEWNDYVKHLKEEVEYPVEAGFGTNEWFEIEKAEWWLENYTVTEITDEEAETLKKLFGLRYDYGHSMMEVGI